MFRSSIWWLLKADLRVNKKYRISVLQRYGTESTEAKKCRAGVFPLFHTYYVRNQAGSLTFCFVPLAGYFNTSSKATLFAITDALLQKKLLHLLYTQYLPQGELLALPQTA